MILLYGIRNLFPGIPAISVIPQGHCPGLNSALFAEDGPVLSVGMKIFTCANHAEV